MSTFSLSSALSAAFSPRSTSMPATPISSSKMASNPILGAVEVMPDRLYYAALKAQPRPDLTLTKSIDGEIKHMPIHFFSIDNELVYWNFFLDFGPLNLGQLYRFCVKLNEKLSSEHLSDHVICFCSNTTPAKRANAMFLICAWQMLYLNRSPEEAFRGFRRDGEAVDIVPSSPAHNESSPPPSPRTSIGNATVCGVPPFHDASPGPCTYELTIMDCLRGFEKARTYGFFDFEAFNVDEYEYFEQVENGDLNWIIKDRIIAFAGPHYKRNISKEGYCTLTPSDYIPYFKKHNVAMVIRLNKKCYDEKQFIKAGIGFFEQYYLDGSCPPMKILNKVVQAFEAVPSDKALAVHCKAGLGRTGTCIGAYMMKHYKFTAAEAIAWMRICRPGCVIGPQQHFLQDIEQRMWHEGDVMKLDPSVDVSRLRVTAPTTRSSREERGRTPVAVVSPTGKQEEGKTPLHFGSLSVQERQRAQPGDETEPREAQGDSLLVRRNLAQHSQHSSRESFSDLMEL